MDELNELIESLMLDIAEEGVGSVAGAGIIWGLFLGSAYEVFQFFLELLASMI